MTLKHVHTLVEALPLAEHPRHELEAAESHARDCIECRQVLDAARWLDSELGRQPEPAAPEGLAATILARTARLDDETAPAPRDRSREPVATARSDRLSWAAALAGIAIGVGAEIYGVLSGTSHLDLTSSRIGQGATGLIEILDAGPSVIVLAAGLLLYLAGVFASLNGDDTSHPPLPR